MSNQQGSTDEFDDTTLDLGAIDEDRFAQRKIAQQETEYARVHAAFVEKMSIARESKDHPLSARARNALEALKLAYEVGPTGATLLSDEDLAAAAELRASLVEQHAIAQGALTKEGAPVR